MIEFNVPGEPGFKRRGRAFRTARGIRVANPAENESYEAKVAAFAREAGATPLDGPVVLEVTAFYAPPRSMWRKREPVRFGTPKRTKPDWDNIGKIVSDALCGVAYLDDAQVCRATVAKRYEAQGEASRVFVRVGPA